MNDRFYLGLAFAVLMLLFMLITSLVALQRAQSLVTPPTAENVATLPCGHKIEVALGGLGS